MNKNDPKQKPRESNIMQISSFKSKYMKIIDGKKVYILDPIKFEISSLMMLFDISKLNILENEFKQHEDGIEVSAFISLMVKELPHDEKDRLNLIYGLYKLFLEIDFNGDNHMQWEEFTQFIIDSVMGENDDRKDNEDEDEILGTAKDLTEKQLIKYKRYNISSTIEDRTLHDTEIIDACFAPKIDSLFIAEYKSNKLKMYNPHQGKIDNIIALDYYIKKESKFSKEETSKQTFTFSIMSVCISNMHNIVAVATTNKRILFFEFNSKKEEFKHELQLPSIQKKVWFLPDHGIWVSYGQAPKNEDLNDKKPKKNNNEDNFRSKSDRYNLNELYIGFENKNDQKIEVYYSPNGNSIHSVIYEHPEDILDIIEIRKPHQYIITACLDKIIRIINFNEKTLDAKWEGFHRSGIRCLDYNHSVGSGYILSVGFEYFINVWSPDVSIKEAFKGKLEGHYAPVIACKFLSNSPMCVSVDDEGNIRIWDTRKLLCLQLIPQEKKNFKVNRLACLPKYNKFILYGNKLVFYDPKYRITDEKPKQKIIDDNYPIRVEFNHYYMSFYVVTQKEVKIYDSKDGTLKKIFKNLKNNTDGAKIKQFIFEERNRKFYLGFSSGAVQQFNAGNGSMIKKIGEIESEKDGITVISHNHSSDVTNMYLNEKDNILFTTGLDSIINIYDEHSPEESYKLKTVQGGHKIGDRYNQINAFDFAKTLNIFATGSNEGLITIWDFELTKIEEICYREKVNDVSVDVYFLKFLEPYPILAAAYSDGGIYFWGVKGVKIQYYYGCVCRTENISINNINKIEIAAVNSMAFVHHEMKEIRHENFGEKAFKCTQSIIESEIHGENVIEFSKDDLSSQENQNKKSYLILGDVFGRVKIIDMEPIFKHFSIEVQTQASIKSNFNILKKDEIKVDTILTHFLNKKKKKIGTNFFNLSSLTMVDFPAHSDSINYISLIDKPHSFITCSKDNRVKIFSFDLGLQGEINVKRSLHNFDIRKENMPEWKFKIDWEKLKKDEITDVLKIYNEINSYPIELFKDSDYVEKRETQVNFPVEKKKLLLNQIRPQKFKHLTDAKQIYEVDDKNESDDNDYKIDSNSNLEGLKDKIGKLMKTEKMDIGMIGIIDKLLNRDNFRRIEDSKKIQNSKLTNRSNSRTKYMSLNNGSGVGNTLSLSGSNIVSGKNNVSKFKQQKNKVSSRDLKSEEFVKNKAEIHKNNLGMRAASNFILPQFLDLNSSQNIKFKPGETERILAYNFYKDSYDSCCRIVERNDVPNESLKKNYDMMWKFVEGYSDMFKTKKKL